MPIPRQGCRRSGSADALSYCGRVWTLPIIEAKGSIGRILRRRLRRPCVDSSLQHPVTQRRTLSHVRWGLVPSWSADTSRAASMINARAETAGTKPAFREGISRRRCLVPADGFYEWQKRGKTKQPYCFEIDKGDLFAFAGIWESWSDPAAGTLETCAILTTVPNELTAEIHNRMPAILEPRFYDIWLNPKMDYAKAALEIVKPFDEARMHFYPVSSRVSHAGNDDPECSAPIELTQMQSTLL